MITFDRDICFVDTETLGLERQAPIWEFAAIRLRDNKVYSSCEFFIGHDHGYGTDGLPQEFAADYRARYNAAEAMSPSEAASFIKGVTRDAIIAGSNPSFDMERLDVLLREQGREPLWHYHPLDIPSMAAGYLARSVLAYRDLADTLPIRVEWKSSDVSRRIGVNSANFARHTAMGDVQWCLAQWRAMNGQEVGE